MSRYRADAWYRDIARSVSNHRAAPIQPKEHLP